MNPREQSLRIEPDFEPAFTAWKANPNPAAASVLLQAVDPILKAGLRAYAPGAGPAVRGRAKRIVLDALPLYDPTRGPLKPHLMSRLQGLRRIAGREGNPIRIPERVALDRLRLEEATTELEDELGRDPSDEELAARTGLSRKRLETVRLARKPLAEGMFTAEEETESSSGLPAVFRPGPDPGEAEWLELVYDSLSPVDQSVMERTLGLHGRRREAPGAVARAMRVSPGAISQRMAKIQALIDRRGELQLL